MKSQFLCRRGVTFSVRIAVPSCLRDRLGVREITKTLKTARRAEARPRALEAGAIYLRLFADLRRQPDMPQDELQRLLTDAKAKIERHAREEAHLDELVEVKAQANQAVQVMEARLRGAMEAMAAMRNPGVNPVEGITGLAARPTAPNALHPSPTPERRFGGVIDAFLDAYPKDKRPAMFKKVQPALALLRNLHGDKTLSDLRQAHVIDFFGVVSRLPPKWEAKAATLKKSPRELAAMGHDLTLAEKTFNENYVVPIRLFIESCKTNWQDEGFPVNLTTTAIEYVGRRTGGESKQRPFRDEELRRLFGHLAQFRADPALAHRWWLPVVGFYTGARVNEVCQINPCTDVRVDSECGHPYLHINETEDTDERVKRSVKAGVSRNVPLHPELIELGFMDYVEAQRAKGAKLLFPAWQPINGRASTQAEKWFRDILDEQGLRDDTPGQKIVGMHAFRHTLLNRANSSGVDAGPITGHAKPSEGKSAVQRGYEGELPVKNKLALLTEINFGITPAGLIATGN